MDRPLRILHTAAHPADTFDMVGGTLAHHIDRGDSVTVVAFSHGVRSHALTTIQDLKHHRATEVNIEEKVDEKEEEVKAGCAILGIRDVRFLRLEDDLLLVKEEHVRRVAKIIRETKPDILITHSPFEHAGITCTHRSCCEIALLARSMASGIMRDENSPPHNIPEVFFMWQHGETTLLDHVMPRFPEIIIDVTDVIQKKVKAMDCLKSQYYPGPLARKLFEACAATQSLHMSVPYGESFMRYYPQVEHYLPVSEHNLRLYTEPQEKLYARLGRMLTTEVPFEGAQK
jgi:4-oxalomesaconate hydratase